MSTKKRVFWAVILWIAFLFVLGVICYVSFQDGMDAAYVDRYIKLFAQKYFKTTEIPDEVMVHFVWKFRQLVRIMIFAILAMTGTMTIHITFHKLNWIFRAVISGVMLTAIAIVTEKFKEYLPTRHFSSQEMMFSILGVLAGFFFISLITFTFSVVKWISRKIINSLNKRVKSR